MIKYIVCYKDQSIGCLYINEDGQYKYEAHQDEIEAVEKKENTIIYADARKNRDWGAPIAFFDSRISNCKRFGMTNMVKYPNSDYSFIKDNSGKEN